MLIKAKPTNINQCTIKRIAVFANLFQKNEEECWLWKGQINKNGYGTFFVKGRTCLAHRVAWELVGNPVDVNLQLDHLCRVRNCVNPRHLEQVTALINTSRSNAPGAVAKRTNLCKQGHVLSDDNVRVHINSRGETKRRCITCYRIYDNAWSKDKNKTIRETIKANVEKSCPICKNTFLIGKRRSDAIYCSLKCQSINRVTIQRQRNHQRYGWKA